MPMIIKNFVEFNPLTENKKISALLNSSIKNHRIAHNTHKFGVTMKRANNERKSINHNTDKYIILLICC